MNSLEAPTATQELTPPFFDDFRFNPNAQEILQIIGDVTYAQENTSTSAAENMLGSHGITLTSSAKPDTSFIARVHKENDAKILEITKYTGDKESYARSYSENNYNSIRLPGKLGTIRAANWFHGAFSKKLSDCRIKAI